MRRFLVCVAIGACSCAGGPATTPAGGTASVALPPTAAPSANAVPAGRSLALVGGTLVDIGRRELLHDLTTDHVLVSAVSTSTAYLLAGEVETAQELRAYDVTTGQVRWSSRVLDSFGKAHSVGPTLDCESLAASEAGAFCATREGVTFYAARDGTPRVVEKSAHVDGLALLDRQVAVLEGGGTSCGTKGCFESSSVVWLDATSGDPTSTPHVALSLRPESSVAPGGGGALTAGPRRGELCAVATQSFPVSGARRNDVVHATCFDAAGRARVSIHEAFEGAVLEVIDQGPRFTVISNTGVGPRSVLVDLDAGSLSSSEEPIASVLMDDTGKIDAFVSDASVKRISGVRLFDLPPDTWPRVRAIRAKGKLVLASFRPTETGGQVVAVDADSGAPTWRADLQLLPISHSRYRNRMGLTLDGDAVVVRGSDASQEYLEVFGLEDGKRLLSIVRKP